MKGADTDRHLCVVFQSKITPPEFSYLAEKLLRGGIAPRQVKRTVAELQDHYIDLYEEAIGHGISEEKAKQEAHSALGNEQDLIKEMLSQWPYFRSRISLTEMVYLKSDREISALYDKSLVCDSLKVMGEDLREQLSQDKKTILQILGQKKALENDPWNSNSFELRRPYLAPLHLLQIEALKRLRAQPEHPVNEQVLMVTMAGIATGMRNTG